jgi:hypothetical protein
VIVADELGSDVLENDALGSDVLGVMLSAELELVVLEEDREARIKRSAIVKLMISNMG